jgi:hypothetical protein
MAILIDNLERVFFYSSRWKLFMNYQTEVFIQIEALLNQGQELVNCK